MGEASVGHYWAAFLIGAATALVGEFGTVFMLDHGFLSSRWWVYFLVCAAPVIAAAIRPKRVSELVILAVGALFTTAGFYGVGVQTHVVSDLANDFDWVIILSLMAGSMLVTGISGLAVRSAGSTQTDGT
jgi:hypothetical protein